MENQTSTGIGCYAKPERLSRIFKKLVQAYTLGPFKENQLFEGILSEEMKGADLLQELMTGRKTDNCGRGCGNPSIKIFGKITGFYLTLNNENLNLSIFTRSDRCRPEIMTTRLDGLTKLRQKRLH